VAETEDAGGDEAGTTAAPENDGGDELRVRVTAAAASAWLWGRRLALLRAAATAASRAPITVRVASAMAVLNASGFIRPS
jgi:hypothetical protein